MHGGDDFGERFGDRLGKLHRPADDLGLDTDYDDLERMELITGAVREMLSTHPEIDQTQTLMVNFDAFNTSSVDFFIYCMTNTVNWQRFHEVKQDVLLKIGGIVRRHGAAIAYPTRTVDMNSSPELAGLETVREKP